MGDAESLEKAGKLIDEEVSDAEDGVEVGGGVVDEALAARRREKKKQKKKEAAARKKAAAAAGEIEGAGGCSGGSGAGAGIVKGVPSVLPLQRGVTGLCDSYLTLGQTHPPSLPVSRLFPSGNFPVGQELEYPGEVHASRITNEEKRYQERLQSDVLESLREAAEVHRQVRKYAQRIIRPGIKLVDMCEAIEETNRRLVGERGLERGIAFPTGCSLNHVAAHYTPNPGDDTALGPEDVMKVDFGVQIGGHIIDCAWTVAFDPKFDPLLEAVRAATDAGIKAAGIDVRLGDIGRDIQEVMESSEIELNGTTYPIKSIRNLNGHSIAPYKIHAGKSVPIVNNHDATKMEELEHFAIETFGSTGRGEVSEDLDCSHYMVNGDARFVALRIPKAKQLFTDIKKTFSTLAFCRRWLERPDGGSTFINGPTGAKQERYLGALKNLCDSGLVNPFPPLVDIKGSYTAQYEVRRLWFSRLFHPISLAHSLSHTTFLHPLFLSSSTQLFSSQHVKRSSLEGMTTRLFHLKRKSAIVFCFPTPFTSPSALIRKECFCKGAG